jgi:hypothetical protein
MGQKKLHNAAFFVKWIIFVPGNFLYAGAVVIFYFRTIRSITIPIANAAIEKAIMPSK